MLRVPLSVFDVLHFPEKAPKFPVSFILFFHWKFDVCFHWILIRVHIVLIKVQACLMRQALYWCNPSSSPPPICYLRRLGVLPLLGLFSQCIIQGPDSSSTSMRMFQLHFLGDAPAWRLNLVPCSSGSLGLLLSFKSNVGWLYSIPHQFIQW